MNLGGTNIEIAKKLQKTLQGKVAQTATAASVAFIKGGELVAACAVGTQAGDESAPATVGDLYNVGSISKVYCSMCVMKLVEMGKVKLDEPVYKYLPRFKMRDERYKDITVRMLINHSSALPGTGYNSSFNSKPYPPEDFYDLMYDYFSKSKLKAAPGAYSVYCNDGFTLAEMLVVHLSGMSFTQFMQKYITVPLGALSACTPENNPENRVLIKEKGKPHEYLSVMGSGGVSTDISDCARMGYSFISGKGGLSRESLDEMCKHQGVSQMDVHRPRAFGLGWDIVDFQSPVCLLGDHVVTKGGGTFEFLSYLIVSPMHDMAFAISSTIDCAIDPTLVLCELCVEFLAELGIDAAKQPGAWEKAALPQGWKEAFAGDYLSGSNLFRVEAGESSISIKRYAGKWAAYADEAVFDGKEFHWTDPKRNDVRFSFTQFDGKDYLLMATGVGATVLAQKNPSCAPVHQGWKARIGKKYIPCDCISIDFALGGVLGSVSPFMLEGSGQFFISTGALRDTGLYPARTVADDDTEMFLDGPGTCARDAYAPFVFVKDGVEYLYFYGFTSMDVGAAAPLEEGLVKIEGARKNKIFSVPAGKKLSLKGGEGFRALLYDGDGAPYHDTLWGGDSFPETKEGYVLLISDLPAEIEISF